jgi:hypothetical protein
VIITDTYYLTYYYIADRNNTYISGWELTVEIYNVIIFIYQ